MSESASIFTVSRVAELLGVDRKSVREQFERGAASTGAIMCNGQTRGQEARAWPLADFPPQIVERLKCLADEHCYGDVARFLEHGRKRWMPRVPIGRLPQAQIDLARKRCTALAPILRANRGAPVAELVALARPAWRSVAGYDVSERTLRSWIERATLRDLGFQEWDRWVIYLDTELVAIAQTPTPDAAEVLDTPWLAEAIASVRQPAAMTNEERAKVWAAAMNDAAVHVDAGGDEASVQRRILRAIGLSGLALAKNGDALRVAYRRKREAWLADGGRATAVSDKRPIAARARTFELPDCDVLTLIKLAREHGNQLAPAYRHAHKRDLLSAETLLRFPTLPQDKSFVPHVIRRAVAPYLAEIAINGRGQRARRLNGAHLVCDWSNVEPGDVFEFDDLTLPLYWWIEDPARPEGFFFGSGQSLFGADSKSGFVLSWLLAPRPGYNARDIIQIVRDVHDCYGLPNKYLLFECGIWKRSQLISGKPSERNSSEICGGLASLWPVRHTYSPTGKAIVERTFGLLQGRMEHIPGYTGRDMRKDCPEVTKRAIAAVKGGHEHPSKHFLHGRQVMELLEEITAEIHGEALGLRTVRIPGKTPKEVFESRDTTRMQRFGPEAEHLFKTHQLERRITVEGIRLPDSLGGDTYRNAITGELIGQSVLAWVDPLDLDAIFITDRDRHNPRLVERAIRVDGRGAVSATMAAAQRQRADQMRFLDVLTRTTKPSLKVADFRPTLVDGVTQALGKEMQRQRAEHAAERDERATLVREFARLTAKHGLTLPQPADVNQLRDVVTGLKTDAEHWRDVGSRAQENLDL